MMYRQRLDDALDAVKYEGRYRIFADLMRRRGVFPRATLSTLAHLLPGCIVFSDEKLDPPSDAMGKTIIRVRP